MQPSIKRLILICLFADVGETRQPLLALTCRECQLDSNPSAQSQGYLYILRSPRAHATIKSIATAGADKAPGVVAVYTSADLAALGGLPCG